MRTPTRSYDQDHQMVVPISLMRDRRDACHQSKESPTSNFPWTSITDEIHATESKYSYDQQKSLGWRTYLRGLGPGLVTGASDDEPSGIATYAQAGAQFGLGMLWVALATFPLMAAVQEICDRTALASGKGLGELIHDRFQKGWRFAIGVLIAVLIIANAMNITADLVAIGAGMHLLHAGPEVVQSLLAGVVIIALLVSGSFPFMARVLKVLTAALLSYVVVKPSK